MSMARLRTDKQRTAAAGGSGRGNASDRTARHRLSMEAVLQPVGCSFIGFESDAAERMELFVIDPQLIRRARLSNNRFELRRRAKLIEFALGNEKRAANFLDVLAQIVQRRFPIELGLLVLAGHVHVVALEVGLRVLELGDETGVPLRGEAGCGLDAVAVAGLPQRRARRPV